MLQHRHCIAAAQAGEFNWTASAKGLTPRLLAQQLEAVIATTGLELETSRAHSVSAGYVEAKVPYPLRYAVLPRLRSARTKSSKLAS